MSENSKGVVTKMTVNGLSIPQQMVSSCAGGLITAVFSK